MRAQTQNWSWRVHSMHDPYYSLLGSTCDYLHINEFIKVLTLQISSDNFWYECQILANNFGMWTKSYDHRFIIEMGEESDYLTRFKTTQPNLDHLAIFTLWWLIKPMSCNLKCSKFDNALSNLSPALTTWRFLGKLKLIIQWMSW